MRMSKGMPFILVCLIFIFLPGNCIAQMIDNYIPQTQANQPVVNCGSDILLFNARKDPAFVAREKKVNDDILRLLNNQIRRDGGNGTGVAGDPYILPVVFHLVNATQGSGYTDQQVIDALKDLNDAFSKSGAYAASTGADTKIRFVLAQKDPDGGVSTGITRTVSAYNANEQMDIEDTRLKNLNTWNPDKYINIWVVNNIIGETNASFGCGLWTRFGVAGYANFPTNTGTFYDGIVVSKFKEVLAHEMGHYLGLYHTFEGGCQNNNCLTDGDRVCDTPPDGTTNAALNCSSANSSCNSDTLSNHSNGFFPRDTTDQIQNFMDYNNGQCANMFTEGQAQRMRAAILSQRVLLLTDVITAPCATTLSASFTRNNNDPKTGDGAIVFTNTSLNTSGATTYQWLVDGAPVAVTKDLTRSFPIVGKFKVTLKIAENGCMASYTDYVIVNCGVTARFYNNKQMIASKTGILNDTIYFTNNSTGATAYKWVYTTFNPQQARQEIASNAPTLSPDDLNYIFGTPVLAGNLKLIATGGGCVDSTQGLAIFNNDPTADAFISIINVSCFQDTKVRVDYYLCNFGYVTIPVNMPVSFYDADPRLGPAKKIATKLLPDSIKGSCCGRVFTDTLDVGVRYLNQLYAVANDAGTSSPFIQPNTTQVERSYTNNVAEYKNFRFTSKIVPTAPAAIQCDTVQLVSVITPFPGASYAWSTTSKLTCATCGATSVIADVSTTIQLSVISQYQCHDTTSVVLTVTTDNEFSIAINALSCVPGQDSLFVDFTVTNNFKCGIIPKGLPVAFFKDDPTLFATSYNLGPVFQASADVNAKSQAYRAKIKKVKGGGNIFAVVNDNGGVAPPFFPLTPPFPESYMFNNFASRRFNPIVASFDTTICSGDKYAGYGATGVYIDTLLSAGGCDSVRLLRLTVRAGTVTRTTVNAMICDGEKYEGYTSTGTYTDKFPGANGCDSIRTLNLTVNNVFRKTNTVKICKGDAYLAGGKLQTAAGTYQDNFKTISGCDSVIITNLIVNPLPSHFLPKDTSLCTDKTLDLSLNGYTSTIWSTGSTTGKITVTQAGAYSVKVVDNNGCTGGDTINVLYERCIPVLVPTAFTPNGDGKNDVFKPVIGIPVTNYSLQVWSRWGEMIYETHILTEGWNGKVKGDPQSMGVFIYMIRFTDNLGADYLSRGTVLLIR
jgi:gliding motility-associated-like protein